jgi:hypothetical protein
MAKVAAIKIMEAIADVAEQHQRPGDTQSPGMVIVIQQATAALAAIAGPMIAIEPAPPRPAVQYP